MVETFNANFTAAVKAGAFTPIWIVRVTPNAEDSPNYTWVSGGTSRFGYDPSVANVTSIGLSMDPLSRKTAAAGLEVVFLDDGSLRAAVKAAPFGQAKAMVWLGAPGLVEADYVQRFEGYIQEIIPEDGALRMRLEDWRVRAQDRKYTYAHDGVSPYQVLADQVGAIVESDPSFSDASSFNPPADRAHWLTAVSSSDAESWTPAADKILEDRQKKLQFGIEDLVFLLGGHIRQRFGTPVQWVPYDAASGIARALTADDISSLVQRPSGEFHYTRFYTALDAKAPIITGRQNQWGTGEVVDFDLYFAHSDDAATERSGELIGRTERTYEFDSRLFHNHSMIVGAGGVITNTDVGATIGTSAGAVVTLFSPTQCGITGAAVTAGALTHPLDSTHKAYLLLVGNGKLEIVAANANAIAASPDETDYLDAVADGDSTVNSTLAGKTYVLYMNYTLSERGLFGTSPASFQVTSSKLCWVFDVTAIVNCCERNLVRFRDPLLLLDVTVHHGHMDLEVADAVVLYGALPSTYRVDGLTGGEVFEIVGKEELLDVDEPCVKLTLAWMRTDGVASLSRIDRFATPTAKRPSLMPFDQALADRRAAIRRSFGRGGEFLV